MTENEIRLLEILKKQSDVLRETQEELARLFSVAVENPIPGLESNPVRKVTLSPIRITHIAGDGKPLVEVVGFLEPGGKIEVRMEEKGGERPCRSST